MGYYTRFRPEIRAFQNIGKSVSYYQLRGYDTQNKSNPMGLFKY
jgi:hypothetical protein